MQEFRSIIFSLPIPFDQISENCRGHHNPLTFLSTGYENYIKMLIMIKLKFSRAAPRVAIFHACNFLLACLPTLVLLIARIFSIFHSIYYTHNN